MHIIWSPSTSASFNLATEEFLFSEYSHEVLLVYVNQPSVIVGCNQAIRNEANFNFCHQNNINIYRRMSGGGAVYHDFGNLNYCFISNRDEGKWAINADFLQPIAHVLSTLGILVHTGKRKDLWLPGNFKISGTASHISKSRQLHHGTLLYDADLHNLSLALTPDALDTAKKGIPSVRSDVKNIRTFLTEQGVPTLPASEFFTAFVHQLMQYFEVPSFTTLSQTENNNILELQQKKYTNEEWILRK